MIPKITKETLESIIDTLEDRFPNKLPDKQVDMGYVHMLIGQQKVIQYLKDLVESKYE